MKLREVTWFYSLDLGSNKVRMWKVPVHNVVPWGGCGTFGRWGPVGVLRTLRVPLKGVVELQHSPPASSFPDSWFCSTTLETEGSLITDWNFQNGEPNSLFLFELIFSGILL